MSKLERDGYDLFAESLAGERLLGIRDELADVLKARASVMHRNGIAQRTGGTAHHILEPNSRLLAWLGDFCASPCLAEIQRLLGGDVVLNTFGAVDNRRGSDQYVANIHRDIRSFSDQRLMMQILVMLDPFRKETGAMWLLPGSHLEDRRPAESEFYRSGMQVCGQEGNVLLFDARTWHAAGINTTEFPRRALTLAFTRPFMKPQFDYCRYLGLDYVAELPDPVKQVLGYFARVPATLDEWYQPPERRCYRPGQG